MAKHARKGNDISFIRILRLLKDQFRQLNKLLDIITSNPLLHLKLNILVYFKNKKKKERKRNINCDDGCRNHGINFRDWFGMDNGHATLPLDLVVLDI